MTSSRHRPPQLSSLFNLSSKQQSSVVQLSQYKKNMQQFIKKVEKDFSDAIDKYQNQIKELMKQNNYLKQRLSKYQTIGKIKESNTGYIDNTKKNRNQTRFQTISPINKHKNQLQNLSQIFTPIKITNKGQSTIKNPSFLPSSGKFEGQLPIKSMIGGIQSSIYRKSDKFSKTITPRNQYSDQALTKSRFEKQSSRKKLIQQNLLHSLQMGKSNLDINTNRIFELLGMKQNKSNPEESKNEDNGGKGILKKKVSISDQMNSSLGSICDSLNNSFHAKKSQQKNKKKKQKQKQQILQKKKKQKEQEEMLKQQSIKNLLKTMRTNIGNTSQKPAQIIRSSKLMMAGPQRKSKTQNKSKVMINPVPIDLHKKTEAQNQSPTSKVIQSSPTKKPQSILKNSTSNILGRSLANISAISFYQSGEQ